MKKQKGFVAIVTVLMISALVLLISFSVSRIAISQLQSGLSQTNGENGWSLTDGCVEDALIKIWANPNYGGGAITRPEGTCSVVLSKAGNVYTLTVNTTATGFNRTVVVTATRTGVVTVTKWVEI